MGGGTTENAAHAAVIERFTRRPSEVPVQGDPADEALRLGLVTFSGEDTPSRWTEARALAASFAGFAARSIHHAAAALDVRVLKQHLDAGASATKDGGPHRLSPLLTLASSRLTAPGDPTDDDAVTAVRLLLDAGADPDDGYLWDGHAPPFTVLACLFGEGEQGPAATPPHPNTTAIARLLLERGADPNDGQLLYDRTFRSANDHLELLFEFGLGDERTANGAWFRRLGEALEPPAMMLRAQLHWACTHGLVDRARLLAANGVDLTAPFSGERRDYLRDHRRPAELAVACGHADVAAVLVAHGAPEPEIDAADRLIGALLRGDSATADALLADEPSALEEARVRRPSLVVWAGAHATPAAIEAIVARGFDVNARGRGDNPIEQPWQTGLHEAAARGDRDMAEALLAAGADPNALDARFDATPLGWARHGGHDDLIALLEPLTTQRAVTAEAGD